jgi:metal-responsive CopG/Arc/MetJ family transcriptional regulator
VKVDVSLPANLRDEADAAAKELGVSRSKFIRTALEEFLNERRDRAFDAQRLSFPQAHSM